jgi:uncharacterized membrane protein
VSSNPLFILSVLALLVAGSEWAARRTWLRHLGSALLVIVATAVAANLGLIPTYSDEIAVYSGVFRYVAPLSIFLLLLQVDLRSILRAGLPMLGMFVLGAAGTTLGVLAGMAAVDGPAAFGEVYKALGGMFVGTYTGGSVNYNAIALHYGVVKQGPLYAGAAAVDSAMTAVWMAVTVALPRVWPGALRSRSTEPVDDRPAEPGKEHDVERVGPFDIALLVALGGFAVWATERLGGLTGIPSVLLLTTLALVLAQLPWFQRLRGARMAGWLAVMLFLAVIGALCDVEALGSIGALGMKIFLFVVVILLVHGALIFGGGALLRLDPSLVAVASQANIGGSTSALALARSLERDDLVLPGILAGALGNGLGTYLGFATAAWLL